MKQGIFSLVMLVLALVSGCDYLKEAQNKYDNYEGRPETVNVQALDAVGYSGTAVRKSVDKVLDMNDQRNQGLEKVLK
ncbi:MAG: hypothetical protein A3I43_00705 [Omnitrophica WOR_2 bacterium RIFCSPLOWO2_02_FULL_50_19]|nr:MAG: hypothetical protein A3I43_00705 [Omnitrophica WOR_2 bacterium RIFCSPLOWO2_02_FULL_50_19]